MTQQPALPAEVQHGGVVQQSAVALRHEGRADQKIPVAVHEENRNAGSGVLQDGGALALKAACDSIRGGVVTHPDFKQVAQDKNRVRAGFIHVTLPGLKRLQFRRLQVQVGNEINVSPLGWRLNDG